DTEPRRRRAIPDRLQHADARLRTSIGRRGVSLRLPLLRELSRETPEVGVGDESALLRAERLDLLEQLGAPSLGHVEAELLGLDADRVEPALLAQHDPARGAHELGRVRLDRRRVVELSRDGSRLAREEILARDGLPRLVSRSGP